MALPGGFVRYLHFLFPKANKESCVLVSETEEGTGGGEAVRGGEDWQGSSLGHEPLSVMPLAEDSARSAVDAQYCAP